MTKPTTVSAPSGGGAEGVIMLKKKKDLQLPQIITTFAVDNENNKKQITN